MSRVAHILSTLESSLSATPESLSQRFGVGTRAIAADIAQLNQLLGQSGSVRLDEGRYRLLVVDQGAFATIRDAITVERESFSSPDARARFILARLVRSDIAVRIDELASEMSVGRTTAVADLAALRTLLAPFEVIVEGRTHVGLALRGPELGIRMAVLRHAFDAAYGDYQIGPELERPLREIAVEHGLSVELMSSLLRWFTVLLDRHIGGHPLIDLPAAFDTLIGSPAHTFAQTVADRVGPLIMEELPAAEVLFLAVPAAGMRTPVDLATLSVSLTPLPTDELVRSIFDRIDAHLDLAIDPADLLPEFSHHVAFMLNRMRYSLHVGDTLLPDQVREAYPVAYRMATIARDVIAERTALVMDENELALATTYFQVFLEQHSSQRQRPFRVMILTNRSPATARLIQTQLAKVLPAHTDYTVRALEPDPGPLDAVDLVVLPPGVRFDTERPTVALSEVFDASELVRRLSLMRFAAHGPLVLPGAARSPLVALLDEQRFVRLPAGMGYAEGMLWLAALLVSQGAVDEQFPAVLAERESLSTMQLGDYVAFPHAVAEGSAELACAMGVIPRSDGEAGLRLIFVMAVPNKADYDDTILIRIYDEMIRLGSDPALVSKISRLSSYEQFFYLMENSTTRPHH